MVVRQVVDQQQSLRSWLQADEQRRPQRSWLAKLGLLLLALAVVVLMFTMAFSMSGHLFAHVEHLFGGSPSSVLAAGALALVVCAMYFWLYARPSLERLSSARYQFSHKTTFLNRLRRDLLPLGPGFSQATQRAVLQHVYASDAEPMARVVSQASQRIGKVVQSSAETEDIIFKLGQVQGICHQELSELAFRRETPMPTWWRLWAEQVVGCLGARVNAADEQAQVYHRVDADALTRARMHVRYLALGALEPHALTDDWQVEVWLRTASLRWQETLPPEAFQDTERLHNLSEVFKQWGRDYLTALWSLSERLYPEDPVGQRVWVRQNLLAQQRVDQRLRQTQRRRWVRRMSNGLGLVNAGANALTTLYGVVAGLSAYASVFGFSPLNGLNPLTVVAAVLGFGSGGLAAAVLTRHAIQTIALRVDDYRERRRLGLARPLTWRFYLATLVGGMTGVGAACFGAYSGYFLLYGHPGTAQQGLFGLLGQPHWMAHGPHGLQLVMAAFDGSLTLVAASCLYIYFAVNQLSGPVDERREPLVARPRSMSWQGRLQQGIAACRAMCHPRWMIPSLIAVCQTYAMDTRILALVHLKPLAWAVVATVSAFIFTNFVLTFRSVWQGAKPEVPTMRGREVTHWRQNHEGRPVLIKASAKVDEARAPTPSPSAGEATPLQSV